MDENNITVVIPTLQKNIEVLNRLLDSLVADSNVTEIIVIDNSTKGLDYKHNKIRIVIPEENLYVNPSWNLGVEEAKNQIVALLNDDIAICSDFCSKVVSKMNKEMGIVGFNSTKHNIPKDKIIENPKSNDLYLEPARYMCSYFGVAMFFYKSNYVKIPSELKIMCGDNYIYLKNKQQGRNNYLISGQDIYHLGSLSSSEKNLNPIAENDKKIYKKLTVKWYNRIYSFEEHWDCWCLRLIGITFKLKKGTR